MLDNIIIIIVLAIVIYLLYKYNTEIFSYITPYLNRINKKNDIKEKIEEKRREHEKEEGENSIQNIIKESKEIYKLPFQFLYKLCITYGIFPMKRESTKDPTTI
jgi:uncharacterized protein (UPF0305 family)